MRHIIGQSRPDPSAQWAFVPESDAGQRIIDDYHAMPISLIAFVELAALVNRNLHRPEIVWGDDRGIGPRQVVRTLRPVDDLDVGKGLSGKWDSRYGSGRV